MDRERESQERREPGEPGPERGMPGGGKGRRETPGRSGVYPVSGPPSPDPGARIRSEASWGQGDRGAEGYQDHGGSELTSFGDQRGLGGGTAGPGGEPAGEVWTPGERRLARTGDQAPEVLQGEFPDKRTDRERALGAGAPDAVTEGELPAERPQEEGPAQS
ncbi:MAG TPA: hypothetical protein VIO14_14110 [Dehalococcoidia bacterium]